jgi:DNA mismatch endonuclease (patch repair protein)
MRPVIGAVADLPRSSSPAVTYRMRRIPREDTTAEMRIRRLLHRQGLRYRIGRRPLAGVRRTADVVFRRSRVVVLVDGCFWHRCPDHFTLPAANRDYWQTKIDANWARDRDTDRQFRDSGWVVLRIWEHEDAKLAAERVRAVVTNR